jgi:transcriptional regulator with XRE-family HTH domain
MAEHRTFYEEVGRRIRETRTDRRMSQEELGAAASLTRTSITNIERGRQRMLLHTLAEIARALQVAPETLFPRTDVEAKNDLDIALKDRPAPEREWIKTTLNAARKGSL